MLDGRGHHGSKAGLNAPTFFPAKYAAGAPGYSADNLVKVIHLLQILVPRLLSSIDTGANMTFGIKCILRLSLIFPSMSPKGQTVISQKQTNKKPCLVLEVLLCRPLGFSILVHNMNFQRLNVNLLFDHARVLRPTAVGLSWDSSQWA